MITTEHSGFKLGDIITTYHKGYWRLVHIKRRFLTQQDIALYDTYKGRSVGEELSPLFTYELVMDSKFRPPSKRVRVESCDRSFCQKVDIPKMKAASLRRHEEFCNACDTLAAIILHPPMDL